MDLGPALALDVPAPAVGAENQILIAIGDVVERDGRKGFEECAAPI